MQRQYNVGFNSNHPGTISYQVDKIRYPRPGLRGPERAWPGGDNNLAVSRRNMLDGSPNRGFFNRNQTRQQPATSASSHLQLPPPRYSPAYTSDVSHLVV